uniref:Uncharacterized protein n=1 Tax=Chaetoceros debilis TaxID=122233 RepID=A0A7S3V424_9STRA|mmetsp:Transcript_20471/g.31063  ORF Transcript_20471/g.31063 Transcript_20471/m.31063 type:complete len:370 (+) Transcript_20471:133-1242(+)
MVTNLEQKTAKAFPEKKNNLSVTRFLVLVVLCLQNSVFTVLRRYSQGVLKEKYSKYEVLLFGEIFKMVFSACIILMQDDRQRTLLRHVIFLLSSARKMFMLSLIYGMMNILSYVALKNVSAGVFTICAQLKILTTATFSAIMLNRKYSATKWRALLTLIAGVLLFSEPVWNQKDVLKTSLRTDEGGDLVLGVASVLAEVTLSGFASIYFEKVIKTDMTNKNLNIWERNIQLALGSLPVYIAFILADGGGEAGYLGGWSIVTVILGLLGSAGGLLVALSIKYGDSILKTLATTGAIVLSSGLDHYLLNGPMTAVMVLSGFVVIMAIFNYSLDGGVPVPSMMSDSVSKKLDGDKTSQAMVDEEVNVGHMSD